MCDVCVLCCSLCGVVLFVLIIVIERIWCFNLYVIVVLMLRCVLCMSYLLFYVLCVVLCCAQLLWQGCLRLRCVYVCWLQVWFHHATHIYVRMLCVMFVYGVCVSIDICDLVSVWLKLSVLCIELGVCI